MPSNHWNSSKGKIYQEFFNSIEESDMNEFRFGFMKNVSSFFLYNTDMLSKQGNRISGNGKWNFLMEYIFQEEKGNEEI